MKSISNLVEFKSLAELTLKLPTDDACRVYLENIYWGGKPTCPHCQNTRAYELKIKGEFKGLYKCTACRKRFTVTVGTVFEASHVPLRKWFIAIFLLTSHKKGIASTQLAKDLGITQKSAWHLLHRLRFAFGRKEKPELKGIVEADETYVGGHRKGKHGRGAAGKTAVFGMVERGGNVLAMPIKNVDADTLKTLIYTNVKPESKLMTDSFPSYNGLDNIYKHGVINHSEGRYADGNVHTQTIEGYWSLLKRGIVGIYHQVSPQHLHRYCVEFGFRYNSRKINEAERFNMMLMQSGGRLMYKDLIAKGSVSEPKPIQ
jgi:transposase-like protein